jgi:hypothetical protein
VNNPVGNIGGNVNTPTGFNTGQRAALSQTTPMYSTGFTPLSQTSMTFPFPNPLPTNTQNQFASSSQSLNY